MSGRDPLSTLRSRLFAIAERQLDDRTISPGEAELLTEILNQASHAVRWHRGDRTWDINIVMAGLGAVLDRAEREEEDA